MNKLSKIIFTLLLAFLVVLPANDRIYASPSDKIYSILERGNKNSEITNPLLLKVLGKKEKKSIKLITTKEEFKKIEQPTKVINDNSYILGLDISKWNGNIDWKAVKAANIDFVIIRAGYGTGYVDPYFKTNIESAIKNDLMIGIYWFSYAHSYQGAKLEAEKCYKTIKKYKDNIDLPVFWDFEYDSVNYARKHGYSISKKLASGMTDTFCTTIKNKGFRAGIYTNIDYANNYFSKKVLNKYHTWIAQWTSNCTYKEHYIMWQCTDNFRINGKKFDLNRLYINRYKYDLQQSKARTKMTVSATAYSGDSISSTMIKPYWGVIAVDPSVISYGSLVYIPYFDKYFVAEDCGGGIIGKRIDIFMNSEKEARNWGVKTIDIYIIE